MLEDGLLEAASYKTSDDQPDTDEKPPINDPSTHSIEPNEYGFPLSVFTKVMFSQTNLI
jgi:hypothetical protein